MKKKLIIDAPARIHIGFLNLDKESSRQFGSLGLTISDFSFKISIEKSYKTMINSKSIEIKSKIESILKILKKKYDLSNCTISVLSEIPAHKGLGSGTQLALSVSYLIMKLNAIKINTSQIACLLKRGLRSGVGIESFNQGGFNIDVGKLKNTQGIPINILNIKWPKNWKITLITDNNFIGVHGKNEVKAFKKLGNVSKIQTAHNCESLLMKIIPGLIEKNFDEFSNGVKNIQEEMSKTFYGKKNKFASTSIEKIFRVLKKKNINSFGQSSWGPTGFIFSKNLKKRNELLNYLENYISLRKLVGINLLKVEGRNFGKKLVKKE